MVQRLQLHFGACMVAANIAGGAIVFLFLGFVLPRNQRFLMDNVIALITYMTLAVVFGCIVSTRAFLPIRQWALGERPITSEDRTYVVRHPLRQALINFAIWMGSELVFIPINARFGWTNDLDVAHTILMGAITTCGLTYLLAERILRPINELAFEEELPTDRYVPGVKSRILLAWAVGTGVPLLGIVMMTLDHGNRPLSIPGLVFLGCVGMVTGIVAMVFAAKSVADPVESVTSALSAVEADRLDVKVPVYDGSQIGHLQNGFNSMVEGLRERRLLRDIFGRQVGVDVARQALERGVRLGGEQVDAAMLFVDVIGSTELAATRPPNEVVAALNAFFAVVVDVVDRTGGFVNKFEGDAALCLFGAPVPRADAATCALLAARLLHERLQDVRGLSAAIGVSAGSVVAGNIGTRERFEYTVIGDAVNEAARLTELAKAEPGRLLVSAQVLTAADEAEREHWTLEGDVVLRGRTAPTQLAALR
ncbi:MAG: adenylate cyclase [Frankiaceae bacterium]|nr:adenylate cyclase [Frankiaceae bacterium]